MKIKFTKNFIEQRKVTVNNLENGDMEIDLQGDFLVFLNEKQSFAVSDFRWQDKFDDTLPVKDLLVDQLQLVDYMQKSHGMTLIDYKFNKDKKEEIHT